MGDSGERGRGIVERLLDEIVRVQVHEQVRPGDAVERGGLGGPVADDPTELGQPVEARSRVEQRHRIGQRWLARAQQRLVTEHKAIAKTHDRLESKP